MNASGNKLGLPRGQKALGKCDTLVHGGEESVQLGFVAFVQELPHVGAGLDSHVEEMAPHHERRGGAVFDVKLPRTFQ